MEGHGRSWKVIRWAVDEIGQGCVINFKLGLLGLVWINLGVSLE
jgi:hypothetical protein